MKRLSALLPLAALVIAGCGGEKSREQQDAENSARFFAYRYNLTYLVGVHVVGHATQIGQTNLTASGLKKDDGMEINIYADNLLAASYQFPKGVLGSAVTKDQAIYFQPADDKQLYEARSFARRYGDDIKFEKVLTAIFKIGKPDPNKFSEAIAPAP